MFIVGYFLIICAFLYTAHRHHGDSAASGLMTSRKCKLVRLTRVNISKKQASIFIRPEYIKLKIERKQYDTLIILVRLPSLTIRAALKLIITIYNN